MLIFIKPNSYGDLIIMYAKITKLSKNGRSKTNHEREE